MGKTSSHKVSTKIPVSGTSHAVTYARYSRGAAQTDNSIEGQLYDIEKYADENDIEIIDNYIDRHISGRSVAGRDSYKKLLRDIRDPNRKFDTVMVWKVDRISRERDELALFRRLLKQYDITLISVMEPLGEQPEGVLLSAVLEGLSEYYVRELSQKVKRGMTTVARKGQSTGGVLPLGYKRDQEGKIVIDENIAPYIKESFEMRLQGKSYQDILEYLNNAGIKSNTGGLITKTTIARILRTEKYKTGNFDFLDVERRTEPLIDEETFDKVQRSFKIMTKTKDRDKFLFLGKAYCLKCGKKLQGKWGTARSKEVIGYYTCPSCKYKWINKDLLEDEIIKKSFEIIFDDKAVDSLVQKLVKLDRERRNNSDEIKRIETELSSIGKKQANLLKLAEDGDDIEAVRERLKALQEQKKGLNKRLKSLTANFPPLSEERVKEWFYGFKEQNFNDETVRKAFSANFIKKIKADDEGFEIDFNVSPETENLDGSVSVSSGGAGGT
ncbi:MAG: recombinase family protein [Clostridiales bacterium]|nr:recombinase family protein [Clostridiales bacterium]